jgi:hypothetical protein
VCEDGSIHIQIYNLSSTPYRTRQAVYVSRNSCCIGKTKSITYLLSVCVLACVGVGAWTRVSVWRMCSLTYPACNWLQYCHLRPLWLHQIFLHFLTDGAILEKKKFLDMKCVFWIFVQLLPKIFLILRRIRRNIVINVKTSLCKVPVILVRFYLNLTFLDRFFEKIIRFNENPFRGSRGVLFGRTDGHDEANISFLQFLRALLRRILSTVRPVVLCWSWNQA